MLYGARSQDVWQIVLDEKEIPLDGKPECIQFVGQTTNVAYVIHRGDRSYVVIGDDVSEAYDMAGRLKVSRSGKHVLYKMIPRHKMTERRRGDYRHPLDRVEAARYVFDGKVLDGRLERSVFSADGNHYALAIRVEDRFSNKATVVVDGRSSPKWEWVNYKYRLYFSFSHEGKRFVYRAGNNLVIVENGEEKYIESGVWPYAFSPDGRRFACCVQTPGTEDRSVWIDGKPQSDGQSYEWIDSMRFSENGEKLGFYARNKSGSFVVVDGREIGPKNGSLLEYRLGDEDSGLTYIAVLPPKANGPERIAVVRKGVVEWEIDKSKVLFAWDEKGYSLYGPRLSPDGKHCVMHVLEDSSIATMVDGKKAAVQYPRLLGVRPHVDNDTYVFFGTKGNSIYRARVYFNEENTNEGPLTSGLYAEPKTMSSESPVKEVTKYLYFNNKKEVRFVTCSGSVEDAPKVAKWIAVSDSATVATYSCRDGIIRFDMVIGKGRKHFEGRLLKEGLKIMFSSPHRHSYDFCPTEVRKPSK